MSGASCKKVQEIFRRARQTAIPLTTLTVSAWAAAYRRLPPERADASGRWRNEVVPYLVEIMDTIGWPGIREIVFVKSSQVGGSELLNNTVGYYAHIEPSPILYVAENQDKAEAWSKESLQPTIRHTPVLRELFGEARSRDSGNTIEGKTFPGGHLAIAWATSAATLSSRPRRVVLMDERDAFKPNNEGDPAKLAEKRAVTFRERKIIIKVSTPRDRLEHPPGTAPDAPRYSPIELEYENSDKRRYFVPCPDCGEYQVLEWKRVKWDSEEEAINAYYVCINGCVIEHESKQEMLALGEWRAEKPLRGRAGFHIWEGYSPFVTWGEMAVNFLEAKKNRATLKVFVNTSLAEGWEDNGEMASVEDLTDRREPYAVTVPHGVVLMTAGVDVQGNRLECEKVGWGLDDENWSIDYRIFDGDPAGQKVWAELEEYLLEELPCEWGGVMKVAAAAVDTGGHHSDEVYRFCRKHRGRRFYAIKGANTPGQPLAPAKFSLKSNPPVPLYIIGTETAKDTLANSLLVKEHGPGYCHFPHQREDEAGHVYYGEAYFKQLRAERPVMRGNVRSWQKIKQGIRNEALDVRVYAMAAKAILKPNMKALALRILKAIEEMEMPAPEETHAEEQEQPAAQDEQQQERTSFVGRFRRPSGRGFVSSWK